jgi:hypothetical protein
MSIYAFMVIISGLEYLAAFDPFTKTEYVVCIRAAAGRKLECGSSLG